MKELLGALELLTPFLANMAGDDPELKETVAKWETAVADARKEYDDAREEYERIQAAGIVARTRDDDDLAASLSRVGSRE